MKAFGINQCIVEGLKNVTPTRALLYLFDGTMPANFDEITFPLTAEGLINNCSNASFLTSYNITQERMHYVSAGALIKSGDIVAKYKGEVVILREAGFNLSMFPDHIVWYPKAISCKLDYRDHNTFGACMYKSQGDYGFDGLDTFIGRTVDNNETIEFEYHTAREVNCFGIKQASAAAQVMFQFAIEYHNGTDWVTVVLSPQNSVGYYIEKFPQVTATRFRIRKISTTGTAANVDIAFAYFGKFDFEPEDIRKNVVAPKYAILVPEHIGIATQTNMLQKQNDSYGNRNLNTEHMILCSAGTPSQNVYMRINFPSTDELDKYSYYLVTGQIL